MFYLREIKIKGSIKMRKNINEWKNENENKKITILEVEILWE
jgi:hypothetical protein